MVAVFIANGFEEIEALTPVDMFRRAGVEVATVGIGAKVREGAHGIKIECDMTEDELDVKRVELAVFPGGMPGALNLDASETTDRVIKSVIARRGRLAAICAAPLIFGRRGLLEGKTAVCYPGFEGELVGAKISTSPVVTDGYITTARAMDVSLEFANELVSLYSGKKNDAKTEEPVIKSAKEYLRNDEFIQAVNAVLEAGTASTSLIQRKLSVGYGKAAEYIDAMDALGLLGMRKPMTAPPVTVTHDEWISMLAAAKEEEIR